jgi:hypothetical protein
MARGIYLVANDKVMENAIALLNSIRHYDPEVRVCLVPFDENYQKVAATLAKQGVEIFPDLEFINNFTNKITEIFDRDFLVLPNKMRKFVLWFGPFDQFLYLDTDIIVFEKIVNVLEYLADFEFICCDYHFKNRRIADIFSPLVLENKIFTEVELQDLFNSGFWASKKGVFSEEALYKLLKECAQHREYFDFSAKTTDQPILNYVILKSTKNRLNLVKCSEKEPGSWAGSKHFEQKDNILYDGDKPLRYLHWAGTPMVPGGAYREIWEYYRYLGETKPVTTSLTNKQQNWWRNLVNKIMNYKYGINRDW